MNLATKIKAWFSKPPPPVLPAGETDPDVIHARSFIEEEKWIGAFSLLNEIKSRQSALRSVDYLRALCFLQRGENAAALESLKEELRFHPDHGPAAALLADLLGKPTTRLGDKDFRQFFAAIQPYTMVGEQRLFSLYTSAREICQLDLAGNFVECGVAAGGSSALLASVMARHSQRPRLLYCFDTFSGMPATSVHDTHNGVAADATGWGQGTCAAAQESLLKICRQLGVENYVRPVQGLFADTLPSARPQIGPIALLHMDGDWYSSTRDILENLFDQVVPQGRVQIDDYGYWQGCKRAVSEFEAARNLKFDFHTIDETGVWMTK